MVTERGVRYPDGHEQWESEQVFYPTVQRFAEWFNLELIERDTAVAEARNRVEREHVRYLAAVKNSLDADAEKDAAYLAWSDALDSLRIEGAK